MYLESFSLENFRCFQSFAIDHLDRLVVLVGENDVGKTVLLDAIYLLLEGTNASPSDYAIFPDGTTSDTITLRATFCLDDRDTVPLEYRTSQGRLCIRRVFGRNTSPEFYVLGKGFADPNMDDFSGAEKQKSILTRLGVTPGCNETERRSQFADLVKSKAIIRDTEREIQLANLGAIAEFLPVVYRIATKEYRSPESLVGRTLQTVARKIMYPQGASGEAICEHPHLAQIRETITSEFDAQLAQMKGNLRKIHPDLEDIASQPHFDFTRSVTSTDVTVNTGQGHRSLSGVGEGTKKRLWIGLLDWEASVSKAEGTPRSVLRMYDEPEANLHYSAQRHLFATISELASDETVTTQCIIATHAVTLIDRAPIHCVNLLEGNDCGQRKLTRMVRSSSGSDYSGFVSQIGQAVGLSNTALLYEKAFLLVEGDSEWVSLPILYKTYYDSDLAEDGIVLVNLHTCSSWRSVVELMLANRLELLHMLLDTDCQAPDSSAKISTQSLGSLNLPPDFCSRKITFVGSKEFEDAFSDATIAYALDIEFPREDGAAWISYVPSLRADEKFSEALKETVRKQAVKSRRSDATKPEISRAIASRCDRADIPAQVIAAFALVRKIAGL